MVDGLRVIHHGLSAGEKIIIKGLVRPGMEVMPDYNSGPITANEVEEKQ